MSLLLIFLIVSFKTFVYSTQIPLTVNNSQIVALCALQASLIFTDGFQFGPNCTSPVAQSWTDFDIRTQNWPGVSVDHYYLPPGPVYEIDFTSSSFQYVFDSW